MEKENSVSRVLFVIGVVEILLGFILGFVFGNTDTGYTTEMVWSVFFMWLTAGFVSGMLFIGFAEVIKILHNIRLDINGKNGLAMQSKPDVLANLEQGSENDKKESNAIINSAINWELDSSDKYKVMEHYKNVSEVIRTPINDCCLVTFKGTDKYTIVDISGFGVKELKDLDTINKIENWYKNF